jgi:hypothetical protein
MDRLLDQRKNLSEDASLCRHAERCPPCSQRLRAWSEIDRAVCWRPAPGVDHQAMARIAGRRRRSAWRVGGLATAALLLVWASTGYWFSTPQSLQPRTITATIGIEPDSDLTRDAIHPKALQAGLEPSPVLLWQSGQWWNAMSDDRWVYQTIPAVDSVRQGVAPIGRSMRQAFAILMNRTHPVPVEASGVNPEAPADSFHEQTSTGDMPVRFNALA